MVMNDVERRMALGMIELVIRYYLPSIRGHMYGGGCHSLDIWQKIRIEIMGGEEVYMDIKELCRGEGCPIHGDCQRWDGNTVCPDTPEECEGYSYYIKPPWVDGWCERYVPYKRILRGEKTDGEKRG